MRRIGLGLSAMMIGLLLTSTATACDACNARANLDRPAPQKKLVSTRDFKGRFFYRAARTK